MIAFACSHCGVKIKVNDQFAGKRGKCPTCKQPIAVPAAETTQAYVPQAGIDGTPSSLDQTGVRADVTLEGCDAKVKPGQKPVRELLAQRSGGQRYVVAGEIGRGGMGAVLRAVDCDIRREVAVKFLLNQADAKAKSRFVEEAQITGQLEHPNIPPVHELGVDGQKRLFFAMKMVKGRSLAQVLDELRKNPRSAEKEWSLTRLLNVLVNICNALAYAHSRGVIHRDLKPANIMVGDFGEVYVMDWGLAKVLASGGREPPEKSAGDPKVPSGALRPPLAVSHPSKVVVSREADVDMTQEGSVLGTPVYMPPEQAMGKIDALDARSDIYSLGAILYEILTLMPPVDKEGGYLAVLMNVSEGKIDPPEQRVPQRANRIPKELSAIAMKALAKEQKDRYPNVETLRKDLERFQEGRSVSAKEDTKREMIWKFVKRNKGFSAGAAAAMLMLLASLWFVGNAWLAEKQIRNAHDRHVRDALPFFVKAARLAANENHHDDALNQLNLVLEQDTKHAAARLLRGQVLIVQQDFAGAQKELEIYVKLAPQDGTAQQLRELCLKANADDVGILVALAELLNRQDAPELARQLMQRAAGSLTGRKGLLPTYQRQIDSAWPGLGMALRMDANGKYSLDLDQKGKGVKDLSPLKGIPLTSLNLGGCGQVLDLAPLKGMPLTWLSLYGCVQVRDLSPLEGMPLALLRLDHCHQVRDLAPLRGMPLTSLTLHDCPHVRDLSPLKDMRLKTLWITGTAVNDITFLADMQLEELRFRPRGIKNGLELVRRMKTLKTIGIDWNTAWPAAEFWTRYDAGEFK